MSSQGKRGYEQIRPIGFDGLQVKERAVLELWDANKPVLEIVQRTGFRVQFVQDTLTRYAVTALEPWKVDAARGSAALVDALRRHFPAHCGGAA